MGISIYPDNATEMDGLISTADAAMYESKARSKNSYTFSGTTATPGEVVSEWIEFNSAYLVGVTAIDDQHRQLVQVINQLNQAIKANEDQAKIQRLFSCLLEDTVKHFETELRLMVQHQYPDMAAHDREHQRLINRLASLADQLQHGSELLALQTVKDWLLGHIQSDDRALGAYLAADQTINPTD